MSILTLAAFLIGAIAWLTAAGMAVRSVSRIWLRHWVERRLAGSEAGELFLDRPHRLLLTASSATAMVVFLLGALIGSHADGALDALELVVLAGGAVLFFGQLIPRVLARRWPAALVQITLPGLRVADLVFSPVRALATSIASALVPPVPEPMPTEEQALEDLLREGQMEGVGERDEIAIITGVVQFGLKKLREMMTPREEIFALDVATTPEALAQQIAQAAYSRIPLYRGTIDNVVGMVHVFDVLKAGGEQMPRVRMVAFADAESPCNTLLFDMLRQRLHLAIIRDASERTVGLVTLEDLLEELVGDIRDEHDEPQSKPVSPPAPGK